MVEAGEVVHSEGRRSRRPLPKLRAPNVDGQTFANLDFTAGGTHSTDRLPTLTSHRRLFHLHHSLRQHGSASRNAEEAPRGMRRPPSSTCL